MYGHPTDHTSSMEQFNEMNYIMLPEKVKQTSDKVSSAEKQDPTDEGTRKPCIGTSKSSKRNRRHKLRALLSDNTFDYAATLGYPDLYFEDADILKKNLTAYVERLKEKYKPCIGFIWVLEYQWPTGKPHFHLYVQMKENLCTCNSQEWKRVLVHGKKRWICKHDASCFIFQFKEELQTEWTGVLRNCYKKFGVPLETSAPLYFEKVKDKGLYISYLCKGDYVRSSESYGRSWGCRNVNGKLNFATATTSYQNTRYNIDNVNTINTLPITDVLTTAEKNSSHGDYLTAHNQSFLYNNPLQFPEYTPALENTDTLSPASYTTSPQPLIHTHFEKVSPEREIPTNKVPWYSLVNYFPKFLKIIVSLPLYILFSTIRR